MVEVKDLILIGAVGAAGILGYKAIKDGLGSISAALPDLNKQAVDYDLASTVGQLIESNNSAVAQLLQAIQANPGGGTVNNYYTIEGSSGELTQKDLTGLTDATTYALESSGAYGAVRQAESVVAKSFDESQESLSKFGLNSGIGNSIEIIGQTVGTSPSLTGTLAATAASIAPTAITPGSIVAKTSLINGLNDLLGLSKKKDPEPEPEQLPEESKASLASALLSYKETYGNSLAVQKLAKKYGLAI